MASAAICVRMVFVPWPNSVFETSTRTLPSGVTSTPASEFKYALAGAGESRAVIESGDAHAALDRAGRILARKLRALGVIVALAQARDRAVDPG